MNGAGGSEGGVFSSSILPSFLSNYLPSYDSATSRLTFASSTVLSSPLLSWSHSAPHPEPSTCRHSAVPSSHSGGSHVAWRAKWVPSSTRGLYNCVVANGKCAILQRSVSFLPPHPPLPSSLTRGRLRCTVSKHRQLKREERPDDAAASARMHKYMFVQVIGRGKAPWTKWTFEPGDLFLHQHFPFTLACSCLSGRRH